MTEVIQETEIIEVSEEDGFENVIESKDNNSVIWLDEFQMFQRLFPITNFNQIQGSFLIGTIMPSGKPINKICQPSPKQLTIPQSRKLRSSDLELPKTNKTAWHKHRNEKNNKFRDN